MTSISEWTDFQKAHSFEKLSAKDFAAKGKFADTFMKAHFKDIKINQLRNFFSGVQTCQKQLHGKPGEFEDSLALLQMNLAYDFGRNVIPREFYDTMTQSLGKVRVPKDFERFVQFVQALIAYHKFHANQN